jgi:hypothetical protein
MNKNYFTMLSTGLLIAIITSSCESHETKADEDFTIYKNEKMMAKDSEIKPQETLQVVPKIIQQKKIDTYSDWTKFKNETEKKITINENKIKELKNNSAITSKTLKKIIHIEEDNNDLRKQMDDYKEEMKMMWDNFKTKIDEDVTKINAELNDIKGASK